MRATQTHDTETNSSAAQLAPAAKAASCASFPLLAHTPAGWAEQAIAELPSLLVDHAHCEKKAAAHALALIAQYPEHDALVVGLAALAQEEMRHFRQVVKIMFARGIKLGKDEGDPYVHALMKHCAHGRDQRLLDRLLIAGLIEARSAERLGLLADALPFGPLKIFYTTLARCEAGHHRLYRRLASGIATKAVAEARWQQLLPLECDAMLAQPMLPRVH